MSRSLAVIAGVAAGGLALVIIGLLFLWFYIFKSRALSSKTSETGSSDPSTLVEWNRGGQMSSTGCGPSGDQQSLRQFTLQELELAAKNFNDSNYVGKGTFGLVYKGLLLDGTLVAIKRRLGYPMQEFVEEVRYLSKIWHRNLVTLIGYCQEGGCQVLVYEYMPNGSISSHLYDTRRDSTVRLEFKQRLSIAIGAAKGLSHLHRLVPPVIHKGFKTSNVLVDENFVAKVADTGMVKLLQKIEDGDPSQTSESNVFSDPEIPNLEELREASDVYSFGVFLLELVTGREVAQLISHESAGSLAQWVEEHMSLNDFIDHRLAGSFTSGGMKRLIRLILQCLDLSGRRRPKMEFIASELDQILETEMTLTIVMGDGTAIVTLGSQLFTSS
ncbi:putative serine/threonine-protein kinase [Dioscorea cayenensis subsp. rotundata]|uniref:non-specific serine/threonine protein kinase n=1 Tax=Dioscorea cayennensis subsp. rotundata TaxID=55577 RepID=A0AB40BMU3_DIOCR|nr:putative serine/threonine-protein kinase [Dioscorea cayenensis subsp. rotundata]XP_039128278.1 putative serine/threonine-protein kinase [Dioscorea cayenensis subsp. rotundata]XP_039128279.1 putative serine/threonine-protein kinase [Dioscorea cayenensis subsp. rotundata]